MTKELAKHAVWFMVLSLCLLLPAAALYLDVALSKLFPVAGTPISVEK